MLLNTINERLHAELSAALGVPVQMRDGERAGVSKSFVAPQLHQTGTDVHKALQRILGKKVGIEFATQRIFDNELELNMTLSGDTGTCRMFVRYKAGEALLITTIEPPETTM